MQQPPNKQWVCYCLESPTKTYVGITTNLEKRLRQHNGELAGGAACTRMARPWILAFSIKGFRDVSEAASFEKRMQIANRRHKTVQHPYLLSTHSSAVTTNMRNRVFTLVRELRRRQHHHHTNRDDYFDNNDYNDTSNLVIRLCTDDKYHHYRDNQQKYTIITGKNSKLFSITEKHRCSLPLPLPPLTVVAHSENIFKLLLWHKDVAPFEAVCIALRLL